MAALSWCLSAYRFTRYKNTSSEQPRLVCPQGVSAARVARMVEGVTLARDLVNTPANDMGPADLEKAARAVAVRHGAAVEMPVAAATLDEFEYVHGHSLPDEFAIRYQFFHSRHPLSSGKYNPSFVSGSPSAAA